MTHAFMHAIVCMRLCGWAMRTIVVLHRLQRHRAGLQCQVQPHSHKQTQGTTGPGLLSLSDVGQQAQVINSATVFAVLRYSYTLGYCHQYLCVKGTSPFYTGSAVEYLCCRSAICDDAEATDACGRICSMSTCSKAPTLLARMISV